MVGRKKGVRQVKPSSHRRSRQLDTPAGIALIKELQTLLLEVSEAEDLFYTNVAGICKRAISPGMSPEEAARQRLYSAKHDTVPMGSFFTDAGAKQSLDVGSIWAGGEALYYKDKHHARLKTLLKGISWLALREALKIATRTTAGGILNLAMMEQERDDDDTEASAVGKEEESGDGEILLAEVPAVAVAGGSGSTAAAAPGGEEGDPEANVTKGTADANAFKSGLSEESDTPGDPTQLPIYPKVDFTEHEEEVYGLSDIEEKLCGVDDTRNSLSVVKPSAKEEAESTDATVPLHAAQQAPKAGLQRVSSRAGPVSQRAHECALAVKDTKIQRMEAKCKTLGHKYKGLLEAKDGSCKEDMEEMISTMVVKKKVVGSVDRGRIQRIHEQDLEIQALQEERGGILKALRESRTPFNTFMRSDVSDDPSCLQRIPQL